MENTKKTKVMYFAELREMVLATVEDQAQQDELVEFIDKQVEALEKRKASAQERAEKKRNESDALTEKIYEVLGTEYMTVDEVLDSLEEDDVTRNKVTARLSKLVKLERVEKEAVKTESGKRMAYRKIVAE